MRSNGADLPTASASGRGLCGGLRQARHRQCQRYRHRRGIQAQALRPRRGALGKARARSGQSVAWLIQLFPALHVTCMAVVGLAAFR
jgi:hypothetical protein